VALELVASILDTALQHVDWSSGLVIGDFLEHEPHRKDVFRVTRGAGRFIQAVIAPQLELMAATTVTVEMGIDVLPLEAIIRPRGERFMPWIGTLREKVEP
jgi:hypothetical protein